MPKGMFTELMETSEAQDKQTVIKKKPVAPPPGPPPQDDLLPGEIEEMSVGYTAHTYRFTDAEMRWLRRFCLRSSEQLDKKITHNALIRVLLRLANDEWNSDPNRNRLRDLLSRLQS
ncbi:MAG: hypothetical protein WEB04_01995 [Dehalococcoidia bacterium]